MAGKARSTEAQRVKRLQERIIGATRIYDAWDHTYDCKKLQQYYLGKQWKGLPEQEAQKRYVINLTFATVNNQLPSLLFYHPQVKVSARPPHEDDAGSDANARAILIENTLQTFIDDPKVHFKQLTQLAILDSFFRFGVVEVGYSADYLDNPNAGKPVLKDNNDPLVDEISQPVTQPDKVLTQESLYLKRIPPSAVRVSVSGKNITEENDWIGYYEWQYVEDVKRNPAYKNTTNLKAGGKLADVPDETASDPEHEKHAGMVKIWKIWDLRAKVRHVVTETGDKFLQEAQPAPYCPLAVLKFYEVPDEWYPLPPVSQWLGAQDEVNETREMMKVHRKRFTRRYTYQAGGIDESELEKLETGGDGVYAKSNLPAGQMPIQPVPDADLSPLNTIQELAATKDDFAQVTGSSGEQRGVAETETATQANIINVRSQIRESQARVLVADWLSQIARLMLLTLRDKMQESFWVKRNTDPFAQDLQAQQGADQQWRELTSQDLGDIDVDVRIDMSTMSPVTEQAQSLAWNQVLALLSNPAMLSILMQSEPLLRKTLSFYGIKSDQEVREILRVGKTILAQQEQMAMAAAMAQAVKGAGGKAGGMSMMGPGAASPMNPAQMPAGTPTGAPGIQ